jgi:NADPH:quinone reductase-like Zn-dependent oxidoreductase
MVDFEKMIFERPALVGKLLEEVLKHFEGGSWKALEKRVFPISKAKEAFQFMSSGQHTGKIVISVAFGRSDGRRREFRDQYQRRMLHIY